MSWYKVAKDFSERNLINQKISRLKIIKDRLSKLSKLIFQNGKLTKESNYSILQDKFLSSYPLIRDILIDADSIALDNPWKFASLCNEAIDQIGKKIFKLKKERENIFKERSNTFQKGWIIE